MKFLPIIFLCLANLGISQTKVAFLSGGSGAKGFAVRNENNLRTNNFEYLGGLIHVDAFLNGEVGSFIFDTGAPTLVINSKQNEEESLQASGIHENFSIGLIRVQSFEWGKISKANFQGLTVDMDHFKGNGSENLKGLIGYEMVANKGVGIDFLNQNISLFSARELKKFLKSNQPRLSLPFVLEGHLPVIEVEINNKTFRLGIDTGAEANILDELKIKEASPGFLHKETIQGLDKTVKVAKVGKVAKFQIGSDLFKDISFLFSDMSQLRGGHFDYNIDGLLGLSFFKGKRIIIDYPRKRIYFYD